VTTAVEIRQNCSQYAAAPSSRASTTSKSLNAFTCQARNTSSTLWIQPCSPIALKILISGSPPLFPPPHVMPNALEGSHDSSTDFALPRPRTPSTIFAFFAG